MPITKLDEKTHDLRKLTNTTRKVYGNFEGVQSDSCEDSNCSEIAEVKKNIIRRVSTMRH